MLPVNNVEDSKMKNENEKLNIFTACVIGMLLTSLLASITPAQADYSDYSGVQPYTELGSEAAAIQQQTRAIERQTQAIEQQIHKLQFEQGMAETRRHNDTINEKFESDLKNNTSIGGPCDIIDCGGIDE